MSAAAQVKPGDVLGGKYKVERVLGTGGMGMVVSARHVQLGQRVALKFMLKEALSDPGNVERFAREARAAVRLQSAHTARVSDVGTLNNGEPYMVMEYLDGSDLDEVLRRDGPMPPHLAIGYILQACEAFAEAHSLGMIHRDIKPKNLFLARTVSGAPIVKVLDFGLAKTIGGIGDVSLTATSAVFGSPQYMSPEQMRSAKDVDTRSDIWSIGVCLYELLTTRVPFDAAGLAEICAMVLKDPVEPPSRWAQGLPPELDAVVVRCLEKDPALRYQTVAELAFALEPWAASEGSAQRILHVMQTVQKTDVPTIMNVDAAAHDDAGAKTLAAWDSGERTRPSHQRDPRSLKVIGVILAMLAAVGVVTGLLTIRARMGSANAGAANPAAMSASAVSTEPPAETAPTSVPGAALTPVPVALSTAPVTPPITPPAPIAAVPAESAAATATEPPAPVVATKPAAPHPPTFVKPPPPKPPAAPVAPKTMTTTTAKPAASRNPAGTF